MPHLGKDQTIEQLMLWFLTALESKIRKMKIPAVRVGGEQELRWDVQSYLAMRLQLDNYRSDKATAEALQPDYLRRSALEAVEKAYTKDRAHALRLLAGVLTSWRIVDALSEAFVRALGKQPKSEERIEPGAGLPFRIFILANLAAGVNPGDFVSKVEVSVTERFADTVVIEDYGWLQGAIANASGHSGSADGVFIIVRVKGSETALAFKKLLQDCGCEWVSTPQMLDIPTAETLQSGQG